jgi:hypothetical protein
VLLIDDREKLLFVMKTIIDSVAWNTSNSIATIVSIVLKAAGALDCPNGSFTEYAA